MLALSFWTIFLSLAITVFTIYVMCRICHIAQDTFEIIKLLKEQNELLGAKKENEPEKQ